MLRLQSLVNASDTLCACSIGKRRTLKSIDSACNVIFRNHVTINKEDVLRTIPTSNTSQYCTNRFISRNSSRLKVLCVKNFHTQMIPQCQAGKTSPIRNNLLKALINEDNVEPRKQHSEKQLLHKQMAYHSEILKEFPTPTNSLHNIYSIVETQLKMERALSMSYKETSKGWVCICTTFWPEQREFRAVDRTKKTASSIVSLQCLHWLKESKSLKNGLPVVFDVKKIMQAVNNPVVITVDKDLELKLDNLLNKYETNVQPIVLEANLPKLKELEGTIEDDSFFGNAVFSQLKQRNVISLPRIQPEIRNRTLLERLGTRKPVGYDLPIFAYKKQILNIIEQNQVVLIKGDTGCGKTTQVPQFIMDSFIERGEASKCNMLVTEPRRISAITLAERIAEERGEKLGDVIGYKVKLQHKLPLTPGAILFCTPGILLRKMQENPNLNGCSHVIIDEAHERKVDVDILLALLKRIIKKNKDIKIIIMSATLNAETFTQYFDCASLDIPGNVFPVKMHFTDEIKNCIHLKKSLESFYNPQIDCEEIAHMVQWISDNKSKGAILCFLPGWNEIVQVETLLRQINRKGTRQLVLPLHSQLSYHDQQRIFESPPPDVRKIILSTDIAETGITVRDVVYVVDSSTHKEIKWDKEKEINTMKTYRIAQANLLQRRGRAGRVQPGESYHFVSRKEYESMEKYAQPEIQCLSLERVILDCKLCVDDKVEEFLAEVPDPPDPHVLRTSLQSLINLGALDTEENLTTLGRKISYLSLPPVLGKMLIYSTIFGCLDPILTVATIFSINMEVFMNAMTRREEIRKLKQRFNENSDHLAQAWIFMQWAAYFYENPELAEKFSFECGMIHYRMLTLKKQREQYLRQLTEMMGIREYLFDTNHIFNKNAQNDELIKAVILSGMNNVLKHVHFAKVRNRMVRSDKEFLDESKCSAQITAESVNYSRIHEIQSPFLTYVKKTYSADRRKIVVRDSSVISPLAVLLFGQGHVFGYEYYSAQLADAKTKDVSFKNKILIKFNDKDNISLMCSEDLAEKLFRLRDCLWDIVRYVIDNQGRSLTLNFKQNDPTVDQFKDEMITLISELLEDSYKTAKNGEIWNSGHHNSLRAMTARDNYKNTDRGYDRIDLESDNEYEGEQECEEFDGDERL